LPVDAAIVAGFGRVVDQDFLTQTVRNGVDFGAQRGAGVRATARAEVRFAGWFRGYGKIVILDHGDSFFTVSGHLDEIHVQVGDRVDEGETIGSVGETGSLSGPRLYFELRRGGEALDPVPWLSAERLAEAR
jgi:septal ring factor EnvC (AmiA/AmiB activator)